MEQSLEQSAAKHGQDMTCGSIPRHLVMFSLPMLAGNVIQTLYSVVNAIWVGQFLGKTALAAITDSFPILFLMMAIGIGITMGTSILIAQFAGAKNWERLRRTVQTSTLVLIGVTALLLLVGELLSPWLMRMAQAQGDVYPIAVVYLRILLLSTPFMFGVFLVQSMLRGVGDSKTPLYFQCGSLILNGILDPLLIRGLYGFPHMGLNGTAVATIAAQAVGLMALFIHLYKKDHIVAPDWLHLKVDWPTLALILKIGLPSVVQQSLVSLGMFVIVSLVNSFGENAAAALGAASRIDGIAFLPAMTFNVAVSTLVGQNLGAGKQHRVKEIFYWGVLLCGGITVFISLFAVVMPQLLLRMFLTEPKVMDLGVSYLRIVGMGYVLFSVMMVCNGIMNGAGHTLVTTVITLIALWAARVPLAVYLSHRMHSVDGIWYAIVASSVVSMSISLICYFSGIWKRPVVRHGLAAPAAEPAVECAESV